jgi:hypothetical protein
MLNTAQTQFFGKWTYSAWALAKAGLLGAFSLLLGLGLGGVLWWFDGFRGLLDQPILTLCALALVIVGIYRLSVARIRWHECSDLRQFPRIALLQSGVSVRMGANDVARLVRGILQAGAESPSEMLKSRLVAAQFVTIPWDGLQSCTATKTAVIVDQLTIVGDAIGPQELELSSDYLMTISPTYFDWQLRDRPALIAEIIDYYRTHPSDRQSLPVTIEVDA